ncbi:uncharacterized protein LOC141899021 [Tubulanus polymorphus]|uniref:uncharacterized protein LOC141899021 n=1 Tax=Tubulanus polymorphus TaxID=672921 RepID=UPI003DA39D7D
MALIFLLLIPSTFAHSENYVRVLNNTFQCNQLGYIYTSMKSKLSCGTACSSTNGCNGFVYHKKDHACQLCDECPSSGSYFQFDKDDWVYSLASFDKDGPLWPTGTYGLPMALANCPLNSADYHWETGWEIQYRSEEDMTWSTSIHWKTGNYAAKYANQTFCMKAESSRTKFCRWPIGSYCIFRKDGICPDGLQEGTIKFDDSDTNSPLPFAGAVPDGILAPKLNTRLWYCCRNDGDINQPIVLPTDVPFYLFQKDPRGCQSVDGMHAFQEWFYYDTEDTDNADESKGAVPHANRFGTGYKLFYCYYEKT